MEHNKRCDFAEPRSPCSCGCGGTLHASKYKGQTPDSERCVNEHMGGELGAMIKKLRGKTYACNGICYKPAKADMFMAYPHDGGLADATGTKWWLYVHCTHSVRRGNKKDECGYDMAWHKIEHEVAP